MGYNGYKNWETWNCYNWLTLTEENCKRWEYEAQEALEDACGDKERAAYSLADAIKEAVEDANPLEEQSFYKDLVDAALQEMDYEEVARAFLE